MKLARALALAAVMTTLLSAQQFKINLDHLTSKAAHTVDISLNGATLQFASRFLNGKDADEAKVKKLIAGLEGIYIRGFEFDKAGEWSEADLEPIRKQLKSPEWTRIVGVKSSHEGENAEIYLRNQNNKITGVAILAADPKELTIVNIAGPIDLDSLSDLAGTLPIPKLQFGNKK